MKTIAMTEIKRSVRQVVQASQKEDVIITRHGQAVARLTRVETADVAELATIRNPAFMKLMNQRAQEETISGEELREKLGLPPKRRRRR